MLNKKIAFALVSFVTLSASSAMAQVGPEIQAASQKSNTVNTAVNGAAFSNTEQSIYQDLYGADHGYYPEGPQIQAADQESNTLNTAIDGAAFSNTTQDINQYLGGY